jgi:hypothetical protein
MAMTLLCPKYGFSDRLAGVTGAAQKVQLNTIKTHFLKVYKMEFMIADYFAFCRCFKDAQPANFARLDGVLVL